MNDPASAEATYRPPAFELLTTARDVFHLPQPAPVLWRDPDPRTDPGEVDAVLSVGEVAILASAGGLGKSCLTLALAVLVSYEDSPARIGARLRWFTETAPEQLHLWANPEPLFQTDPESRGAVTRCDAWPRLWKEIKAVRPSLVIVDPVSAALADADTSQTGPARTFLGLLSQEAATAGCGVLLVAHDTKSARNLVMTGQDPGAGAVAGSAAWYDGARGVLILVPDPAARDSRLLVAIKANYGRTGWGALLTERCEAGKFRGLELQAQMDAAEVNQWREGVEANPAKGTGRVDGWETGGASKAERAAV